MGRIGSAMCGHILVAKVPRADTVRSEAQSITAAQQMYYPGSMLMLGWGRDSQICGFAAKRASSVVPYAARYCGGWGLLGGGPPSPGLIVWGHLMELWRGMGT